MYYICITFVVVNNQLLNIAIKITAMKIYNVTKENNISNYVVKELNAAVCTSTFKNTTGLHKADLYSTNSKRQLIVARKHCKPIDATFIKNIYIRF